MPDTRPPTDTPDASLVAATLAGDRAAYASLVARHERPARATCYALLRDWHDAHDAAQDAFLRAYADLRSLRDPASFGPWLLTIARRRAAHLARRRPKHQPLHAAPEPAAPTAPIPDALLDRIASLPPHERAVLLLRYVDGHDVAHIAHLLNRPVGTITKQLSRAHDRLRQKGPRP